MVVNFYLKDIHASYETSIYCLIRYQNKNVKHSLGKKINPKDWNLKEQKARKSLWNSPEFNNFLNDIKGLIANLGLEWTKKHNSTGIVPIIPPSYLKEKLNSYLTRTTKQEREESNQKSFWGYYNEFINRMKIGTRHHLSKGTPMSDKYIFQFENLKRHLENYQRFSKFLIEFDKIDLVFYNDFCSYLTVKLNLGPNTIGKLITNLKVLLKEAFDDGVSTNNIFANRKFRAISFESPTIYLNPLEIQEIIELDLRANLKLERVRDLFIIGCYTSLRFGDIINLKPASIIDEMIEITQEKTKERVAIPIRPQVAILLAKYNNTIKKISNQKFNEYLYEVVKLCKLLEIDNPIKIIQGGKNILINKPKYEFVTSHTARRSFATNEYMLGDLSIQQIMSITGHKSTKSFYKYIRMTPKENAEMVKIKWKARDEGTNKGNLKVVA